MIETIDHFKSSLNASMLGHFEEALQLVRERGFPEPENLTICAELLCEHKNFGFIHELSPLQVDIAEYTQHRDDWVRLHALPLFASGISMTVALIRPWDVSAVRSLRETFQREIRTIGVPDDVFENALGIVDSDLIPIILKKRKEVRKKKLASITEEDFFSSWKTLDQDAIQIASNILQRAYGTFGFMYLYGWK